LPTEKTRGISGVEQRIAHMNLSATKLVEMAISRGEGELAETGALRVSTGPCTGRSPKDKFIVEGPSVKEHIDWGGVNHPISEEQFECLYNKAIRYMADKELYVFDGYAGVDSAYRLPIRVINEYAWQNLFARHLFVIPTAEELKLHIPEFVVIALPGLQADPSVDGTRSGTFIALSFERRVVLIGGTHYAGEIKKSIFSVLNYSLPFQGVFPMHCSANVGAQGDVALFFGLSGTGKTTLSADPNRSLIGDDEHGWSDTGVFNFEGGCYAKCVDLSQVKEPQIWNAVRFATVLENVVLDPQTGTPDYKDISLTENTRAAYPVDYIPNAVIAGKAGHPQTILFLTADAFGVLPPIAKLTQEQAVYYFLSGYTSKLAGTERGVTKPLATFSACFAAPFLPLHPQKYAELLRQKIERYSSRVYLINTGWAGGASGAGKRIDLKHTRAMVTAALNGGLEQATFICDPVFNLQFPDRIDGVPDSMLDPRNAWQDKEAYHCTAVNLAKRFVDNFEKFGEIGEDVRLAGPSVKSL
jgi:phosphoenolpyruvate carboxykinase (ATP)